MPEIIICPGISGRRIIKRPCIICGGERDRLFAYMTNQGKRSVRLAPRCRECENKRNRERHAANPEKGRAQCRNWYARNAGEQKEYRRKRQQDPAHRALKAYHQRLRKARLRSGQSDNADIRHIYWLAQEENKLASMCPVFYLPELGKLQVDHIQPLSKGGEHIASNLQIIPAGINMRKGVKYYG